MSLDGYSKKDSVVVVYTGDGKGKTSAGIGLIARGLGAGWRVAFVQFIKSWEVNEHKFIKSIMPLYETKLAFYKGGLGFFEAGDMSANASHDEHLAAARSTFEFAYDSSVNGQFDLVICDEINNAVHDGLLKKADLMKLLVDKHPKTNLCLTGRNFPSELLGHVDIATDMTKIKHHFDDKFVANPGIDY